MMLHFDQGAATDAANSRLNGRKRVADALVQRNLAAAGYPINERPDSQQRREIGLALARIKDRSRTPVQPVQIAFNETAVGPGVAPRALDYAPGRTATMPLHSPAGPIRTGAPGRYRNLPAHKIAGDAQPMGQLFGTGTSAGPVPPRGHGPLGRTEPASSRDNQRETHTGYILPIQRDGETGAWSPAVPRLAQDIWDEAVSAATLPGDVQSGSYHLPSLGEPGISEDDAYNVYRDGERLGNRLANERGLTNRTIGAAGALTSGGTGFTATHGAKAAMDPSLLRMGGGRVSSRPPNMSPPGAKRRGAFGEAKRVNGIPVSQQPLLTSKNLDRRGDPQPGRRYEFELPKKKNGKTQVLTIRDDARGHNFGHNDPQNRGPHFNDPKRNHYDY